MGFWITIKILTKIIYNKTPAGDKTKNIILCLEWTNHSRFPVLTGTI